MCLAFLQEEQCLTFVSKASSELETPQVACAAEYSHRLLDVGVLSLGVVVRACGRIARAPISMQSSDKARGQSMRKPKRTYP